MSHTPDRDADQLSADTSSQPSSNDLRQSALPSAVDGAPAGAGNGAGTAGPNRLAGVQGFQRGADCDGADPVLGLTTFTGAHNKWGDIERPRWSELINELTHVIIGDKDGRAFIPAVLPKGRRGGRDRRAPQVELPMSLLVLDIDSGLPYEEIKARLICASLECVGHTTHSHMSDISTTPLKAWEKWQHDHPNAMTAQFLIDEKHMRPEIAAGAAQIGIKTETFTRPDGRVVETRKAVFRHQPCPKMRCVFMLAAPLPATRDNWQHIVLGFAESIGLLDVIDTSSTKQEQIFYMPRALQERVGQFSFFKIQGRSLTTADLEAFREIGARIERHQQRARTAERRKRDASRPAIDLPSNFDFKDWNSRCSYGFRITEALRAEEMLAEPIFTGYVNNGHEHILCPFEEEHSNDTKIESCVIMDGEPGKWPYMIYCQHDHCRGRAPLEFLQELIRQGKLTIATLLAYSTPTPEFDVLPGYEGGNAIMADKTTHSVGDSGNVIAFPESKSVDKPSRLDHLRSRLLMPGRLMLDASPEFAVHDLVILKGLHFLVGERGAGKSFLAMHMAACISTGAPVLNHSTRQLPVLYVAAEGPGSARKRFRALEIEGRLPGDAWLEIMPAAIDLGNKDDRHAIAEIARQQGQRRGTMDCVVIIDTLQAAAGGRSHTRPEDVNLIMHSLTWLIDAGLTILVIDHPPKNDKDGDPIGGVQKGAAADVIVSIAKNAAGQRVLRFKKARDGDDDAVIGAFSLRAVALESDSEGNARSAAVVAEADASADFNKLDDDASAGFLDGASVAPLGNAARDRLKAAYQRIRDSSLGRGLTLLGCLKELTQRQRALNDGDDQGAIMISLADWQAAAEKTNALPKGQGSKRTFLEWVARLQSARLVVQVENEKVICLDSSDGAEF